MDESEPENSRGSEAGVTDRGCSGSMMSRMRSNTCRDNPGRDSDRPCGGRCLPPPPRLWVIGAWRSTVLVLCPAVLVRPRRHERMAPALGGTPPLGKIDNQATMGLSSPRGNRAHLLRCRLLRPVKAQIACWLKCQTPWGCCSAPKSPLFLPTINCSPLPPSPATGQSFPPCELLLRAGAGLRRLGWARLSLRA
jgi:hypothetical protein